MFLKYSLKVMELDRKSFAFLNHEDLKIGEYRELSKDEVQKLKDIVE